MIGGGCVLVLILGFVGLLVAGGLLWDRGVDAGGNIVSNWVEDQIGTDISDRDDAEPTLSADLPEPRAFETRDEYLQFLDAYTREFGLTMENIAELLANPQLRDDDWQSEMAREIAAIRQVEEQARSAQPPDAFNDAHEQWSNGMGEYRRAVDSTANALDSASPSGLVDAIDALNNATRSFIEMGRMLEDIGALDELQQLEDLDEIEQDDL